MRVGGRERVADRRVRTVNEFARVQTRAARRASLPMSIARLTSARRRGAMR